MQKDKGTPTSGDICPCHLFLDPRFIKHESAAPWDSQPLQAKDGYTSASSTPAMLTDPPGGHATSLDFLSSFAFALDRSTLLLSPHRHHACFPTLQPLWFEI